MADRVIRATAADLKIRAFAASTTDMVEEARQIHGTSPVITAAMGRLMTAGAMMCSMMKGDGDILTLYIKSDGPAKALTVTGDSHGNIKAYPAVPDVEIPLKPNKKLDVGGAIGKGSLSVIYDIGLKDPYCGSVKLQTGEIGDDLAYYYTVSEQVPSAVGVGVMVDTDCSVRQAGGFIVQLMPETPDEVITKLENAISGLEPVTTMMEKGMGPEDMLQAVLGDMDLKIGESSDVRYHCNCSKDRVSRALAAIDEKDLRDMINDGETIEVKCHFCNTAYNFSIDELQEILDVKMSSSAKKDQEKDEKNDGGEDAGND
ncbi:MAG: Hsp33 family molecular chaperone HslO [Anaerovoracaceae bacterium]